MAKALGFLPEDADLRALVPSWSAKAVAGFYTPTGGRLYVVKGVSGFTSYATATYLDLHTTGPLSDSACPDAPPPMDTGQTDRMEQVRVP